VKNHIVRVTRLRWGALEVVDERDGSRHVLCRQWFRFSLQRHLKGVEIDRLQLPAIAAWAITVNKAQGMTMPRALLDMRRPFWQHGTGYVAPSRIPRSVDVAAYVDERSSLVCNGVRVPVIRNVVYPALVVS
jgi:hypothetical protein